jgi:hypothetical protein
MSTPAAVCQDPETYVLPPEHFGAVLEPDKSKTSEAGPYMAERVVAFNADVAYALRSLKSAVDQSREYLLSKDEAAALPRRARLIFDRYALVDTLALFYRDRTRNVFMGLLVAAFTAALIFELFTHLIREYFHHGELPRGLFFLLYPLCWGVAWMVWRHAHRQQYQRKYQDYRALAEGLRVQLFWGLLGLPDRVEDYYLRKHQGELHWIRRALGWWRDQDQASQDQASQDQVSVAAASPSPEELTAYKELVRRRWVRSQSDFFANIAGPREQRRGLRCKQWGTNLFIANLVLAVATLLFLFLAPQTWLVLEIPLILLMSALLVAAAIVVAYGEKMAFSEHTRQYRAAQSAFEKTDAELTDGPLTAAETTLFRDLGKEALRENGDWLLLHRDRPLEIIVP